MLAFINIYFIKYLIFKYKNTRSGKFILTYIIFVHKCYRSNSNTYLQQLTRDNVQLLINAVWSLPTERVEETIVAQLPKPQYVVPRTRSIPKPKPLTKWQQFAKEKGIRTNKKNRTKLKWDEELQVCISFSLIIEIYRNLSWE